MWEAIYYCNEQNWECWCCNKWVRKRTQLERSHIVPSMLGGGVECKNLLLLCKSCHRDSPDTKNPKYMQEFIKGSKWFFSDILQLVDRLCKKYPISVEDIIVVVENWKKAEIGYHGAGIAHSTLLATFEEEVDNLFKSKQIFRNYYEKTIN